MKTLSMLLLFVLASTASACCEILPTPDADATDVGVLDASREDAALDATDALELDAADAQDATADAIPPFCIGRDAEPGGALRNMSCACERAAGTQTCFDERAECIVAPSQPEAWGCHLPCGVDPGDQPCPGGTSCVNGYCWFLCQPTVPYGCPGEMLQCVPYENPIAGTQHVCVPKLGYRAP